MYRRPRHPGTLRSGSDRQPLDRHRVHRRTNLGIRRPAVAVANPVGTADRDQTAKRDTQCRDQTAEILVRRQPIADDVCQRGFTSNC